MIAGKWKLKNGEILGVDLEDQRKSLHEQAKRLWGENG
jgi:hypothetical protein